MEFYNKKNRTARKIHNCDFCNNTIQVGDTYSHETGKYNGDFFDRKLCLCCSNILSTYLNVQGVREFDWDNIADWLSDTHCCECEQHSSYPAKNSCECIPAACIKIRKIYE